MNDISKQDYVDYISRIISLDGAHSGREATGAWSFKLNDAAYVMFDEDSADGEKPEFRVGLYGFDETGMNGEFMYTTSDHLLAYRYLALLFGKRVIL